MDLDEVLALLRSQIRDEGWKGWLEKRKVNEGYLHNVLSGRNKPGPGMLLAMGLRRKIVYEPK